MAELRRRYGFWAALGNLRLSSVMAPESIAAIVIGGGGAAFMVARGTEAQRVAVAGDFLPLAGALLGVVFAGFALVIAFLSDKHLQLLETVQDGTVTFLRPFMISTGLQVGAVVGSVVYRAGAAFAPTWLESAAFVVLSMLFILALFDVVALARMVMMHGVTRGREAARGSDVTPIAQGGNRRDQRS